MRKAIYSCLKNLNHTLAKSNQVASLIHYIISFIISYTVRCRIDVLVELNIFLFVVAVISVNEEFFWSPCINWSLYEVVGLKFEFGFIKLSAYQLMSMEKSVMLCDACLNAAPE